MLAMTIISFLFVAASVAKGERSFSRQEWAFLAAAGAVFALYMFTRDANFAAALTTAIDALGYGPTFVRGWAQPRKDSVTSFALNGVKFVPSLMAMDPISFAIVLSGDGARSQHGGRDHVAHAQARLGLSSPARSDRMIACRGRSLAPTVHAGVAALPLKGASLAAPAQPRKSGKDSLARE